MPDFSIKEYVFHRAAQRRIPISGTFEITSRCNLNCKMCYIHMTPQEQSYFGHELSAAEWIHLGRQAVKEGMIYLLLTGGEPLLRPDFCEIYRELSKMGLLITVNTNGTLLTQEIVRCFKQWRPEKVNITLYGMSENSYQTVCGNGQSYTAVLSAIRELKEAGINVNLNSTFIRDNITDMEKIIDFAKEHQIPVR